MFNSCMLVRLKSQYFIVFTGFPTGGFSHSGGLEAALKVKNVTDKGTFSVYMSYSCYSYSKRRCCRGFWATHVFWSLPNPP